MTGPAVFGKNLEAFEEAASANAEAAFYFDKRRNMLDKRTMHQVYFYYSRNVVVYTMIELDKAAIFKALGDPTRLRIFEFLCWQCCPVAVEENGDVRPVLGPTVGEVCCHVTGADRINSTISFHLKELRLAGLITVDRHGKNMICGVNRDAVVALTSYLGGIIPDSNSGACCE